VKPYYADERVTLYLGDCLSIMPTLEAGSFDAIVTDPPYGLSFMGKVWDHGVPAAPFWAEALRVAKPGAHLVAFGGTRTYHRLTCAIEDAGWEIRDCLSWLYGSGFPKSHNGPWGGTALKPAWEPIILARKPLAGTVAANHQQHSTGALNIDGCRLTALTPDEVARSGKSGGIFSRQGSAGIDWKRDGGNKKGRWPANVVLDEDAARLLDEASGDRKGGGYILDTQHASIGYGGDDGRRTFPGYSDNGGASRFFYTAKASRSERNAGLDGMPRKKAGMMQDDAYEWKGTPEHSPHKTPAAANHHPTVKPLDLMQWLCRLVTPKGGLILDPFCGSGSTGRAAVAEGFRFVGIELDPEYAEIARARINEYAPLFGGAA
jgi:DNA modification methylase